MTVADCELPLHHNHHPPSHPAPHTTPHPKQTQADNMADNMADAEEQQITAVAAPDANAEADQVSENSRRQIKATQRRQVCLTGCMALWCGAGRCKTAAERSDHPLVLAAFSNISCCCARACLQKQLAQEFEQALDGVQKQQELRMQQGGAAGALAKERRKDVRSVLKVTKGGAMEKKKSALLPATWPPQTCISSSSSSQQHSHQAPSPPANTDHPSLHCCHAVCPHTHTHTQAITDASTPIEERLRLLQTKYVAALQDQLKQDKQLCEAQERLEASNKEAQAGRGEGD